MKKFLLLFVFSAATCTCFSANTDTKKEKISALKNSLTEISGAFEPLKIETFQYNLNHFGGSSEKSVNAENDSIPTSKTTFEYDGKVITGYTSIWNLGKWSAEIKSESFIRSEILMDSVISYTYDTINSSWKRMTKFVMNYNDGLHTDDITYVADSLTGVWMPFMKTQYTFNTDKTLKQEEISMNMGEELGWLIWERTQYFYANNKLDHEIGFSLNFMTSAFEENSKTQYYYDANGILESEIWSDKGGAGNEWQVVEKTTYKFNSKGIEYLSEYFNRDLTNQNWIPSGSDLTLYENDEKPLVDISSRTSLLDQSIQVNEKTYYRYDSNVKVTEVLLPSNAIQVYPNPTTDFVNITIENPANASFRMFDLSGKIVKQQQQLNQSSTFSTQGLKKGNYIVKVRNNGVTHTQLIMIN